MNPDTIIGRRQFTDGMTRDVYLDDEGQYVLDDGERVYGVWLLDADADSPVIATPRNGGFPLQRLSYLALTVSPVKL
jgi:hypothetical protein